MKHLLKLGLCVLLSLSLLLSACNKPSEEDGPLTADDVKARVIKLMTESNERQDPSTLFSFFDGDFSVSDITGKTEHGETIRSIKRKGAVTQVSTSIMTYYGVEAAGFLFYADDYQGEAGVYRVLPLDADAAELSTIFTVFGIDTSAFCGGDSDDTMPTLSPDMLTVSEDLSTCTFSKDYIDTIAREICEAMSYNAAQTADFLKKYQGSGTYSVAENKLSFEISLNDRALGNLHQLSTVSVDAEGRVSTTALMEYSNPSKGIAVPIVSEVSFRDVVYREGVPVSATISLRSTADVSYSEGSYPHGPYLITATEEVNSTFVLDCTNPSAPKATATSKKVRVESCEGDSMTTTQLLSLSIDQSSSTHLTFSEIFNGHPDASMTAGRLEFATPASFPTVPSRVTNAITKYINDNFS